MPFRFRRRASLFPGLHLNLSRSGVSATVGVPGLRLTLGKQPAISVGLPGSGVFYRESLSDAAPHAPAPPTPRHVHVPWLWVSLVVVIAAWVILAGFTWAHAIPLARR